MAMIELEILKIKKLTELRVALILIWILSINSGDSYYFFLFGILSYWIEKALPSRKTLYDHGITFFKLTNSYKKEIRIEVCFYVVIAFLSIISAYFKYK